MSPYIGSMYSLLMTLALLLGWLLGLFCKKLNTIECAVFYDPCVLNKFFFFQIFFGLGSNITRIHVCCANIMCCMAGCKSIILCAYTPKPNQPNLTQPSVHLFIQPSIHPSNLHVQLQKQSAIQSF